MRQDPAFALGLLADIPSKALSPGVNDPTTATQALDQIEVLLVETELALLHSASNVRSATRATARSRRHGIARGSASAMSPRARQPATRESGRSPEPGVRRCGEPQAVDQLLGCVRKKVGESHRPCDGVDCGDLVHSQLIGPAGNQISGDRPTKA
jgi:hypothetical protein